VRQRNYLEAVVANTSDAMIALNQQFLILDLNPAANEALGRSAESLVGRGCTEVLRCRNLNRMELCNTSSCPLVRVLDTKKSLLHEELIIGTGASRSYETSTSVVPVAGESGQYVIFTARNMSDLKVAHRVRSNFVSMVSHELRIPLNSVHGFMDLLLQGHMGALSEEQHTYLGYAQVGVEQLVSIIEDLLFMTRSDLGQFEIKLQEVLLRSLVRQVMSSFQPQARKAGVALYQDIPSSSVPLYVDPQRIKQVLNNLVANALKFTPSGGTVTIRARRYDESYEMISVADTGYGIPVEDRLHVFERFYQSNHYLQSKMAGYGLGLAIAKLIVEQHGGSIGFDSIEDQGTTFFFTLPIHKHSGKDIS
jgi:PAS domain S-box-containing protein